MIYYERFQVLMVARMKMTAFWVIVLCSPTELDRRFRGSYCLHHQGSDSSDDERQNSETLVYFSKTSRHYNPEGCHLDDLSFSVLTNA
jgi:hypothetical protein